MRRRFLAIILREFSSVRYPKMPKNVMESYFGVRNLFPCLRERQRRRTKKQIDITSFL